MRNLDSMPIQEIKEKGKNLSVIIKFLRHANKEKIQPHEDGKISDTGLSARGKENSRQFGKNISADAKEKKLIIKQYVSKFGRSEETADELEAGLNESGVDILETRVAPDLNPPHFSQEFIKEYRAKFKALPDDFKNLPVEEQEKLIEDAESPAVEYWLKLWDKKFDDETESAKEVAERISNCLVWINKMTDRLNSGSNFELINNTHRTVIEPLLVSCLKEQIDFTEMGGPLNLLEDLDFKINVDTYGNKKYGVYFREKEYEVDWEKISEFAGDYKKRIEKIPDELELDAEN